MAASNVDYKSTKKVPHFELIQEVMSVWVLSPEIGGCFLDDKSNTTISAMNLIKYFFQQLSNVADALADENQIKAKSILDQIIHFIHEQLQKTTHPKINDPANEKIKQVANRLQKISNTIAFQLQKPFQVTITDIVNFENELKSIQKLAPKQSNTHNHLRPINNIVEIENDISYEQRYFVLAFKQLDTALSQLNSDAKSCTEERVFQLRNKLEHLRMKIPYELRSKSTLCAIAMMMTSDKTYFNELNLILIQLIRMTIHELDLINKELPNGLFSSNGKKKANLNNCIDIMKKILEVLRPDIPLTITLVDSLHQALSEPKLHPSDDRIAYTAISTLIDILEKLSNQLKADKQLQLKK